MRLSFSLVFFAALCIAGLAWASENWDEYLDIVAIIAFLICVFVLLPCAFFRATQKLSMYGLYISSVIFGASTWICGFLATLQYWGVIGVVVGVIMGVVGIVPLGMLASAFHSDWLAVGQLALGLVLTYGARMTAVLLAARIDRDEAGIKSNSFAREELKQYGDDDTSVETRSPQATSVVPEWAVLSAIGIAAFAASVVLFMYFTHASGSPAPGSSRLLSDEDVGLTGSPPNWNDLSPTPPNYSGDVWVAFCSKSASEAELETCVSYTRGVADTITMLQKALPERARTCIPLNATGNDLTALAFPYVQKQPSDVRQFLAAALLIAAFHEAYPCTSQPPQPIPDWAKK